MCREHHDAEYRNSMDRKEFLKLGGAGLAGAALLGSYGSGKASAKTNSSLKKEFDRAAKEYGVPAELLLAMGYVNTRWEMPPERMEAYHKGDLHAYGSYGIMALVKNPWQNTLGEASKLTGIPEAKLKGDRASNIRGGAALLSRAMRDDMGSGNNATLGSYYPAVAGSRSEVVAGVGSGHLFADQVFNALRQGVSGKTSTGEKINLSAQRNLSVPEGPTHTNTSPQEAHPEAVRHKPAEVWYPANSHNYTASNRPHSNPIGKIIIHVTQGSWSSAINWFQDPRAQVSAHYVIRSHDGKIAQCVSDMNIAWHAGNWPVNVHSIGIEHEGYFNDPRWFTSAMYHSSAKLVAYLCRRYGIPPNRHHILGHNQVAQTECPGRYWWWRYYMKRVRNLYYG